MLLPIEIKALNLSMNNTKQAFWALFGSLSAFSFSIISSVILSRYLEKSDYGTYKQILYVYGSLLVIFTLGLPKTYSFFLPRVAIQQARSTIKKINLLLFICGMCLSLTIFFGAEFISTVLNNKDLALPLKYFALVPTFLLPTIGLEGILSSFRNTQLLAVYQISTKLIMLLFVAVPVALFDGDINSAIIGFTVASAISFLIAQYLKYYPTKNIESETTTLTYKELFNYSFPIMLASIWGVIISSSDQFFISRYFGPEVFADFANGSLELPFVGMVVGAISIVLSPIYSKKASENNYIAKDEIIRLWTSAFSKTVMLTYPLVAFFWFFSHPIMIALYGPTYINSGDFFQIKLLVNFFTIITYGPLILSIGGNKFYYQVHMYGALFLIILQAASIYLFRSPLIIVWISVICSIGRILIMLTFVARYFQIKTTKLIPWMTIVKILPCFLLLFIIESTIFQYMKNYNLLLSLVLSGFTYGLLFLLWAIIVRLDYLSIVKSLTKK